MARVIRTSEFRNRVENREGIVLVDFYATWCGPCKMLSPVFESIGNEMMGRADFFKVDIDQSMEISEKYQISTVPTLIIFKNGREIDRLFGFIPKEHLRQKIESYM
ncbi:thioredoxin [Romboutsia weinsteinii]|uniref:Thioredoxin n=1 Tax=Romboutsia weinsteinii TaxID=2020949 RepID=A0A371J5B9_9FIRM|nr:thioredoxin [Romboutsia weinsteinii]RDY27877.1 thioredoxin [Romboutsia weinsteinii]